MKKAKRRNLTEDQKKNIFAGFVVKLLVSPPMSLFAGLGDSPPPTKVQKKHSAFWEIRSQRRRMMVMLQHPKKPMEMEKRQKGRERKAMVDQSRMT